MAGPQFFGGKAIAGQNITVSSQPSTQSDKADSLQTMNDEGLDKFMNAPDGSFSFGHSGSVTVANDGGPTTGSAPGHEITGGTDLHVGSSIQPSMGGNVYMPSDGLKPKTS